MLLERLTPDLRRCIFRYCNEGLARAQIWVGGRSERDLRLLEISHDLTTDSMIVSREAAHYVYAATQQLVADVTFTCAASDAYQATAHGALFVRRCSARAALIEAFRQLYGSHYGCGCLTEIVRKCTKNAIGFQASHRDHTWSGYQQTQNSMFALANMPTARAIRWREWLARH